MKHYILLLMVAISAVASRAQSPCDINDIHTNPSPSFVRPPLNVGEPSYRTNRFDWRREWWPIRWDEVNTGLSRPISHEALQDHDGKKHWA